MICFSLSGARSCAHPELPGGKIEYTEQFRETEIPSTTAFNSGQAPLHSTTWKCSMTELISVQRQKQVDVASV